MSNFTAETRSKLIQHQEYAAQEMVDVMWLYSDPHDTLAAMFYAFRNRLLAVALRTSMIRTKQQFDALSDLH